MHVVPQVLGLLHAGRFDEPRSTIEFVAQVAESQQGTQPRGFAAIVGGFVALLGGRPADGARLLREAESHWAQVRIHGIARWAAIGQVLCLTATGDLDDARAAAARVASYPSAGFGLYEAFAPLGLAWIRMADKDVRGAVEAAEDAIAVAVDQGAVTHLAIVAHDLARARTARPRRPPRARHCPPTSRRSPRCDVTPLAPSRTAMPPPSRTWRPAGRRSARRSTLRNSSRSRRCPPPCGTVEGPPTLRRRGGTAVARVWPRRHAAARHAVERRGALTT